MYPDELQFKWDDGSDWPRIETNEISWHNKPRPAQARNVFTSEVTDFSGLDEGERLTGVDKSNISAHLQRRYVIPIHGYNFRYVDWNTPWPEHSRHHLKVYRKYPKKPPDGVFVYDEYEDKEFFFCSRVEASEFLKTTKGQVAHLIRTQQRYKKRYRVRYLKLTQTIGLASE